MAGIKLPKGLARLTLPQPIGLHATSLSTAKMLDVEYIVAGAGVVGLAIARELALAGREVILVEAEAQKGLHASSRNTAVIHAGIKYPKASLKGRLCLEGKKLLYEFCAIKNIPHSRLGKLVIAERGSGEEGVSLLHAMRQSAQQRGLEELHFMTAAQVTRLEPAVACDGALWSPTSGIIDVHAYMDALADDIESAGAAIAYLTPVAGGKVVGDKIQLRFADPERTEISCSVFVNATGLNAPLVARATGSDDMNAIPPRLISKGTYCVLRRRSPFSRLIYPAPHGVHASLDLGGQLRFGPDAQWVSEIDYRLEERRIDAFYEQIRRFWPDLQDDDLAPGWVGNRAKVSEGKTNETDFRIAISQLGQSLRAVNLYGIDSPGLTASLAIGRYVRGLLLAPHA